MTNKKQPQATEDVILEYPYKPFGILKVTTSQLIFQEHLPGFNTFSGVINISDVVDVRYLKGLPILGVPGLEIEYQLSNGQIAEVRINFVSSAGRLGIKLVLGVTPEKVFETIVSLKNSRK